MCAPLNIFCYFFYFFVDDSPIQICKDSHLYVQDFMYLKIKLKHCLVTLNKPNPQPPALNKPPA